MTYERYDMGCERHNQDQVMGLFQSACNMYDNHELDEALEQFMHMLDYHTDTLCDWNLNQYIGMCYYYKNIYDKAAVHLENAYSGVLVDDEKDNLSILLILSYLAKVYMELEDYEKSMGYFRLADKNINLFMENKRYSSVYLYHLSKGRCFLFMKKYEDAIVEYRQSMDVALRYEKGEDAVSAKNILEYELARAYYGLNKWRKVYEHIKNVNLDVLPAPHHSNYRYYDIIAKTYLEKYNDAIKAFVEYRDRGIDDYYGSLVHYYSGIAYFHMKRYTEARSNFQKALSYANVLDWVKEGCENFIEEMDSEN